MKTCFSKYELKLANEPKTPTDSRNKIRKNLVRTVKEIKESFAYSKYGIWGYLSINDFNYFQSISENKN